MTANSSQGQYPTQTTGNMPQQSTMIQQQGISTLRQQSPMNQWENRPRISLQTSHHPQNPRPSVPQQQPFTMQMRPTGQTIVQASQVSSMKNIGNMEEWALENPESLIFHLFHNHLGARIESAKRYCIRR